MACFSSDAAALAWSPATVLRYSAACGAVAAASNCGTAACISAWAVTRSASMPGPNVFRVRAAPRAARCWEASASMREIWPRARTLLARAASPLPSAMSSSMLSSRAMREE